MIQDCDLILFQGDSITNAFRKPEEVCNAYQPSLWRYCRGLQFWKRRNTRLK
jgi:hypothetical protein